MPGIPWQNHIVTDPEIHHGEPCITRTRVPVAVIAGSIADGKSFDEVVSEYPQLTPEAIQAALAYQAQPQQGESLGPS